MGGAGGKWDESKHPRAEDGKFGVKNGTKIQKDEKEKRRELTKRYSDTPERDMAANGLTKSMGSDTVKLVRSQPNTFERRIREAKKSNPNGWAVDAHAAEDYGNDKLFMTPDGLNGIAVEPNGNIVSVFKHAKSTVRGAAKYLLDIAIKNGGDRLDAYGSDLYRIYTQYGFEPVSWVKWDDEYAPADWKPENGKKDIVFYKYVGKENVTEQTYEEFKNKVSFSADYDTAQKIRDDDMKGKKQ